MAVGYLANAFDLLNVRDLDLIGQARGKCSRLVLGVFSDEFAERLYGRRPVVPLVERLALVSHVRGVDEVVTHDFAPRATEPGDLTFVVAGDLEFTDVASPVLLTPRRTSLSAELRSALEPLAEDEVA